MKSPIFPWSKFPGVDTVLGPEMKSTGEVMGSAETFGEAFAKAQLAAGQTLPTRGTVFISVTDRDKAESIELARRFVELGFSLVATHGTAERLEKAGLPVDRVFKVKEGRPNVVDLIKGDRVQLVVNTPHGQDPWFDEKAIRRAAITLRIPTITTLSAARAAAEGIAALAVADYIGSDLSGLEIFQWMRWRTLPFSSHVPRRPHRRSKSPAALSRADNSCASLLPAHQRASPGPGWTFAS